MRRVPKQHVTSWLKGTGLMREQHAMAKRHMDSNTAVTDGIMPKRPMTVAGKGALTSMRVAHRRIAHAQSKH